MPKSKSIGKLAEKAKVEKREPLWKGPQDSSDLGGLSQSMINDWLVCRERFRLKNIEGLQPPDRFNYARDYGTLWHFCEEHTDWEVPLKEYCQKLCLQYPLQQEEIHKAWQVCRLQFPIYQEYWQAHQTKEKVEPLLREETFKVPYELPSGRVVYLRGKFDGVDLAGTGKDRGIYLFETKTKSDIEEAKICRTLKLDLQTMLYTIAMKELYETKVEWGNHEIKGVRYNCIRRPLSGGKGNIRPHQATKTKPAETNAEYYERLKGVIMEDIDTYFLRLKVEVYPSDIERFKKICLNPILEQMCDWYDWVTSPYGAFEQHEFGNSNNKIHFVSPFGLYNPILESGQTDLDELLLNGSEVGLQKIDSLFPELA